MTVVQNGPSPAQPQQASLSFTEGFLLGQLSVVILIGAFIKFFIFGEPPSAETTAANRALARSESTSKHKQSFSISSSPSQRYEGHRSASNILRNRPPLTASTILAKTYYNVNAHQPESLDWFNVLIAQTIAQFRNDAQQDEAILASLTDVLNGPQKPDFLSAIKVTEISLGEDFPILSNCRIHPVEDDGNGPEGGRLQARMDVDLSDFITLGVETKIILNYPKPMTAILPISLSVSIVRFSGTLSISFLPSSTRPSPAAAQPTVPFQKPPSTTPTTLAFSFLPDYRLDLSVRSLLGSRSRLQDIPKIAQLVETRLHSWIDERVVEPRVQQVVLPSFWPRKQNTRGPSSSEEESIPGGGTDERVRDIREEARREVEEERRRQHEAARFDEGLRRRAAGFEMPGAFAGQMVT